MVDLNGFILKVNVDVIEAYKYTTIRWRKEVGLSSYTLMGIEEYSGLPGVVVVVVVS